MENLQILMIAPHYAPYVGGAETHTQALAESMVGAGQRVTVLTDRGHRRLPAVDVLNGVHVLRTGWNEQCETINVAPRKDTVRWEEALFGLLAEIEHLTPSIPEKPDVIHAQCQISFLLGAVLKEHFGCPLVVTPHETLPTEDGLGEARSRLLFNLPQIDLFIAGSRVFAEQARTLGRSAANTVVVESSVRPPAGHVESDWILTTGQHSPDVPMVLSVGRFKPRKNQMALLDAMALLKARGRRVFCVLAGACDAGSISYRDALSTRAVELGLASDVKVVEGGDDTQIAGLIRVADLVVQPATAEGLGLVTIEALGAGTTVLATPTCGSREVLAGYPLLLTAGFTPCDIASAIEDALDRRSDYAAVTAQAAKSVRARFDARSNTERLLNLYINLVRGRA